MMGYNFQGIGVPFQQNNFLLTLNSMEIGTLSPKNTQESQKKFAPQSMLSALRSLLYAHTTKFPVIDWR